MNGYKFTRREKIILMILGIFLLIRLLITLIIFRCRVDPYRPRQSLVAAIETGSPGLGTNCGLLPRRRCRI